jgi:hypothetical protein
MTEVPIQASPVDRRVLLARFVIEVPAGLNPAGKDAFVDEVLGPEPNDRAYFSARRNTKFAVCRILSSYAVGRCLRGEAFAVGKGRA